MLISIYYVINMYICCIYITSPTRQLFRGIFVVFTGKNGTPKKKQKYFNSVNCVQLQLQVRFLAAPPPVLPAKASHNSWYYSPTTCCCSRPFRHFAPRLHRRQKCVRLRMMTYYSINLTSQTWSPRQNLARVLRSCCVVRSYPCVLCCWYLQPFVATREWVEVGKTG